MSVLLLATSALFCHCTFEARPKYTEKEPSQLQEVMKAYYQNLAIMQTSSAGHIITLEDFKVGYSVSVRFVAPSTGLFALNLYGTGENIVLHIVARYDYEGQKNILVLNTFQGGSWQSEVRPSGFNFQPGIDTVLRVAARKSGFDFFQDSKKIVSFPYRSGLPVESVRRINEFSLENQSAQDARVTINFV